MGGIYREAATQLGNDRAIIVTVGLQIIRTGLYSHYYKTAPAWSAKVHLSGRWSPDTWITNFNSRDACSEYLKGLRAGFLRREGCNIALPSVPEGAILQDGSPLMRERYEMGIRTASLMGCWYLT